MARQGSVKQNRLFIKRTNVEQKKTIQDTMKTQNSHVLNSPRSEPANTSNRGDPKICSPEGSPISYTVAV